ncbi:hypothetical protein [Lacinutrix chionoecetis]
MPITKFKNIWKEITLLTAWIVSVAGTFIITFPSWTNSDKSIDSYIKFIILFATVIAGFLVLYSLKNKKIKTWSLLSIVTFILLIFSFISYSYLLETKTLPYENHDVIIGNVRVENDPITKLEAEESSLLGREDILKHVQGESEKIWTKSSINNNRIILMVLYTLAYTFTACFIISFCNLILLNKEKYNLNKPE